MRDWLRGLPGRASTRQCSTSIVPLTPDNAHQVRLSWYSDLSLRQLERHVEAYPGLSFMVESGEAHILGGYWRRRREIGAVLSVTPRACGPALVRALLQAYRDRGATLVLADYQVHQHLGLLTSEGFDRVETIVRYERQGCDLDIPTREIDLQPFTRDDNHTVLRIERESFPWLWWNSREELDWYSRLMGVEIWLVYEGQEPIGYSGFTVAGRDGHLDRIAIRRRWQGQGFGAALLSRSLQRMGELGVRRVALSTQSNNRVSQSMYRRFGFQRSHWSYDMYGLWLREQTEDAEA